MDATPGRQPGGGGGSSSLSPQYMQLALYLAGNALTIVIGLLIWNLNTVLADFRDSMLYALLCSIALRPVKDWLVAQLDASLADPRRSVAGALLSLAALPLTALVDAWEEGRAILAKWRAAVAEEFQRRQAQLKRGASADAGLAATPTSPRTPRTAAAAAAAAAGAAATAPRTGVHSAMPSLAVYGHAAVRVLKSRRTTKKRRRQRAAQRRAPEGSSLLFRWLFRTCAAWLVWEWVRDSWSATVQLVLLVFTAVVALGLVPLLVLTTNRYLAATMFSPVKTPTAASAASAAQATGEGHKRRGGLASLGSPPKRPCFTPFSEGRQGRGGGTPKARPSGTPAPAGEAAGWWDRAVGAWEAAREVWRGLAASLGAGLRSALRANLHALVALALILGLFVGTTGLAAFLSVRVAQEGRATVLAVRDVFPAAWAGMAASAPLLADADAAAGGGGGGGTPSAAAAAAAAAVLPDWVASYRRQALALAQQALPAVASWGEGQFYGFMEKQNLTAALGDIRLLYETLQGPRRCSEREREKLVVALARGEVAQQGARDALAAAEEQLEQSRVGLHNAVVQLEAARALAEPARPAPAADCAADTVHSSGSEGGSGSECPPEPERDPAHPQLHQLHHQHAAVAGDVPPSDHVLALEAAVVEADGALRSAKEAHKAASLAADAAEREQRAAAARLALCSTERAAEHHAALLPGVAGEVGAALQRAYAKLWRRQLREGLADMRGAAGVLLAALRGVAHRSGGTVGDLGALHRLAAAAADPLLSVGRVAGRLFAGSLGSTTAAAVMGGLGVLRLGMGVVKFGMQLMLFLALLYYLLAARTDPLLAAVGVLPLSEGGRQRTAVALNRALGGVLVSSMKLIAFHGCFSWITFRALGLPLTYTASVASAVCALLPFVPTYAVALPGCVVLLAQGRLLAALLFFGLHFLGYYIADTAILEDIPGGHPYMLSLGILGGIYAFENPLQGCLLGPILLSLLSVFYNLHSEFMGGGSGGSLGPDGRPQHRLWSLSPLSAPGTAQQQATTPWQQQQQQHVRLSGVPPSVAESPDGSGRRRSPERSASLRIHVPQRRGPLQEGDAYSPAVATSPEDAGSPGPGSLPQQQQQRQRQRPQERPPSRSVSLSLRPTGPGDEEEEEEEERGSTSASVGNSFSFFGALAGASSAKLHDD